MWHGFLNLDKPQGITAHDCISRVRKALQQKKVGHSGTLDPMATGVLPIALGNCTRLLRFLQSGKAYKATVKFGITTTTDDLDGEVLTQQPCPALGLEQIYPLLSQFIGTITQRPPAFSAIQVNGDRLYDLARAGVAVVAPLRTVEVYALEVLNWQAGDFPELTLAIRCGSGTYIRAIARDLGLCLRCGATLSQLQRTYSNGFAIATSIPPEQISPQVIVPAATALAHLPRVNLEQSAANWLQGQAIAGAFDQSEFWRVYGGENFLGIGQRSPDQLQPIVVLRQ